MRQPPSADQRPSGQRWRPSWKSCVIYWPLLRGAMRVHGKTGTAAAICYPQILRLSSDYKPHFPRRNLIAATLPHWQSAVRTQRSSSTKCATCSHGSPPRQPAGRVPPDPVAAAVPAGQQWLPHRLHSRRCAGRMRLWACPMLIPAIRLRVAVGLRLNWIRQLGTKLIGVPAYLPCRHLAMPLKASRSIHVDVPHDTRRQLAAGLDAP